MPYNRYKSVEYAHKWAYGRNPQYFSFDGVGGDCTNFVSQCLYAGCGVMNYTRDTGWYYNSPTDRAAAWTGVEFLYKFLTTNKGAGPYAAQAPMALAKAGDIIQLSFDGAVFSHSAIVVDVWPEILLAHHSADADNRPLSAHQYRKTRLLQIVGVRY